MTGSQPGTKQADKFHWVESDNPYAILPVCNAHNRWPCKECGSCHFKGCECFCGGVGVTQRKREAQPGVEALIDAVVDAAYDAGHWGHGDTETSNAARAALVSAFASLEAEKEELRKRLEWQSDQLPTDDHLYIAYGGSGFPVVIRGSVAIPIWWKYWLGPLPKLPEKDDE